MGAFSVGLQQIVRASVAIVKEGDHSPRASRSSTTRFHRFQYSHRSIARVDSNGIDCPCRMDGLETKTRMIRILAEDSVCPASLTLNLGRQFGEQSPEL